MYMFMKLNQASTAIWVAVAFTIVQAGCDDENRYFQTHSSAVNSTFESGIEVDNSEADVKQKQDRTETLQVNDFEGIITNVGGVTLTVAIEHGGEQEFLVNEETEITLDGNPAGLKDLGKGQSVTIAAEVHEDLLIARQIDATQIAPDAENDIKSGEATSPQNTLTPTRFDGGLPPFSVPGVMRVRVG